MELPPVYNKFSRFIKRRYRANRINKITLNNYATCPNKDGTKGWGGCVFCNHEKNIGVSNRPRMSILEQLETAIGYIKKKYRSRKFIAHLSANTPTYQEPEVLCRQISAVSGHPLIVAIEVSTRPDTIDAGLVRAMRQAAAPHELYIELGVQTLNPRLLTWMRRGHTPEETMAAVDLLTRNGVITVAHLMYGFPPQMEDDSLATVSALVEAGVGHLKFHNLMVLRDTPLADDYGRGVIVLPDRVNLFQTMARILMNTPKEIIIHRLFGDAPRALLLAPEWVLQKQSALTDFTAYMRGNGYYQGKQLTEQIT